ncbi:MAG: phosphatidylserine decarboxylase family protein [Cyclobacteriaceae bacterium]
MMIHKEGRAFLLVVFLFFVVLSGLVYRDLYHNQVLFYLCIGMMVLVFLSFLQFFRNPKRNTQINNNHIIAPADGKIVIIEEVFEKEFFKDKRMQVSIFMSPINVHVNRNAISGEVSYYKYHPGKYLVAWHPKSSELNERNTVVFKRNDGKEVLLRQIAGAVARRIRCYVQPGDKVVQGEDYGFIKFGSRVDLFLPLDAKINVKIGDKPRGGETVIAEW